MLIIPGLVTDAVGIGLVAITVVAQIIDKKRNAVKLA